WLGPHARCFFSTTRVQALLTQNWWGEMEGSTPAWKLLLTFFCPPLIFTNLIAFRTMEEDLHRRREPTPLELENRKNEGKCPMGSVSSLSSPPRPGRAWLWRWFWGAPV
ncbi:transient receptor potential cation channel subfamily M member 4, partial [Chelydra serpentina]